MSLSELRRIKLVMANLVLENANLTNEVFILKRLLEEYETQNKEGLLTLARAMAKQIEEESGGQKSNDTNVNNGTKTAGGERYYQKMRGGGGRNY